MGHFVVKSKVNLDDVQLGQKFEESDFSTLTPQGNFVQMEYVDDKKARDLKIKPGIWSIKIINNRLDFAETSFTSDEILESFVNTKAVTDKINHFFNKLDIYKEFGIEVPRRGVLLYGPPGTGKSCTISKIIQNRSQDKDTSILYWNTAQFDPSEVKTLLKSVDYSEIKKFILIAEDIGGMEMDQTRFPSDSSLLSILDNQEKIFTIPTMIIATTNFPETFLGNLTNRPQRFDDKFEVTYPTAEGRVELFKFIGRQYISDKDLELIKQSKFSEFTPAHLREIVIRSKLYDRTIEEAMNEIHKEIESFKKNFSKKGSIGMGL